MAFDELKECGSYIRTLVEATVEAGMEPYVHPSYGPSIHNDDC